jgi:uncharacterized protein
LKQDPWIKKYNSDILPIISKKIKPEKIYLIGSRVSGRAKKDSDIDIIVVSEYFHSIPFIDRMEKLLKLGRFEKHIDYLCYTPEEFEEIKNSSSIIQDAMQNYICLK